MAAFFKFLLMLSATNLVCAKAVEQCPVVALKSAEQCFGLISDCWSPGEGDIDCPNNGLCCFDGCVNKCGIPPAFPVLEPDTPTTCTTDYITQSEDVPEEMCVDFPGMETCTTTSTSECEQQCHYEEVPETVTEITTCCKISKELVCVEGPCNPNGGSDEVVTVSDNVCKKREKVCYNVPEQVCHDEEVEECKDVPTTKCEIIKKPTEWPTINQVCDTKYQENCKMVNREICNDYYGHFNPKLHHLLFKKKKFDRNPMCYTSPVKVCRKEPYTDCKNVTTVTIEYEDVEECHTVTQTACELKVQSKCEYVDKEECNEAEDICEIRESTKTVFVKNNCYFPDKECHYEDVEQCEDHDEIVEKSRQKKVCKNVCRPVVKKDCKQDEPTKDCRTVFKTMSYTVPIQKC